MAHSNRKQTGNNGLNCSFQFVVFFIGIFIKDLFFSVAAKSKTRKVPIYLQNESKCRKQPANTRGVSNIKEHPGGNPI